MRRPVSYGVRVGGLVGLLVLLLAPAVHAQDVVADGSVPLLVTCADDGDCAVAQPLQVAVIAPPPAQPRLDRWRASFATWRTDAGIMFPLYAGFSGLQLLDVHSTTRAIGAGATEGNALMSGVAHHPAALTLVKAGAAASAIYVMESKVRMRSRIAAIATMVGLDSAYAIIVEHNYRAAR
jgi:hypothetical protein